MIDQFVHLHLHSEYSIKDSLIRIPSLMNQVTALSMPAIAITDQMNLFSAVKFYKACLLAGIKPIIGADICVENLKEMTSPFQAVLLCQNEQGYKNLIQLVSRAYVENQRGGKPIVRRSWLRQYAEGLIALSGGIFGDIGLALTRGKLDLAQEYLNEWLSAFSDRFYLELQRIERQQEEAYNRAALELAKAYQVPVVATNDVRFLNKGDFEAHEARVCIHSGWLLADSNRPNLYSDQQYLRAAGDMASLFADVPEAIQNTVEIARRCNVMLSLDKISLPHFPVPTDVCVDDYFEKTAKQGLETYLNVSFDSHAADFSEKRKPYDERLRHEITIIKQMGFAGYFLIVADFVHWAQAHDVPVGPGRGSGAGSLAAFVLKITGLDPLKYDLLFERFLNPERVSMPDFDIDFCMEGRDRVIEYVTQKYGRQSVSQIITYGTMAARGVVRDVGRVLGYGYGFVDKIARLIPFTIGITLSKALDQEEMLKERYEKEEEVKTLIDLAQKLEGLTRNAGKHAGGVVISPSKLTDFTPLYCETHGSNLVSQFDKDDVEAVGLIKFDFLGLRTLTIIKWALEAINQKRKEQNELPLDIASIPMDDAKVFTLFKACRVTAVFQSESRVMRDLIKRVQPDCFEDIIVLMALIRPGPSQQVDDFINRKHGQTKVEYIHSKLVHILKPTYGVILYQEQVMQIAQVLAGYSLGNADLLRRAMGKKKPKEMAKQRKVFIKGALKNGVDETTATYIFDLMEKFAGYGFNKSHSAAYALIAYQTAWLKVYYPVEFMAAVLSSDMDNTEKLFHLVEECRSMGLTIIPPDVNKSESRFIGSPSDKVIIYGLSAIKGVGLTAVKNVVENRNRFGLFQDLFDFCNRVDLRKVNRRVLEALIKSGAMDSLAPHRAVLLASLDGVLLTAEQRSVSRLSGQRDLFGGTFDSSNREVHYRSVKPWTKWQLLQSEKEILGYYLSGHPIEQYYDELQHIITARIADLSFSLDRSVRIAGLVIGLRTMNTRRGDRMAFMTVDDGNGRVEIAVFSDVYHSHRNLFQKDQLLVIEGDLSLDEYTGGMRMNAKKILHIEQAREIYAKYLLITVNAKIATEKLTEQLAYVLEPYRNGTCPVCIAYHRDNIKVLLPLNAMWHVFPTDDLIQKLRDMFSDEQVTVCYN